MPTLLKGYSALGGQMVINQKIALGQTSYQPEVEQLIAAKPQVIFTEASPQADATFLAELQQLGHLIPVIGSDATVEPAWLPAVAGAIGKPALSKYFVGAKPYAPASGPAWQVYNKYLLASAWGDQAGVAVERRLVLDGGLRRAHRHGAGRDRGEEHQPGRME